MASYFGMLDGLIAESDASGYLARVTPTRRLTRREVDAVAAEGVVGGFKVPERSVDTVWIAERLADAIQAEAKILFLGRTEVKAVLPVEASSHQQWEIIDAGGTVTPADIVVNCSWENLLLLDRTAGLLPTESWSYRYRLAVFLETRRELATPSAVLAVGPFGDVKNYNGRRFYLSWYPAGLVAHSDEGDGPPEIAQPVVPHEIVEGTRRGLSRWLHGIDKLFDDAAQVRVDGGWVVAQGRGSLSDPASSLHRRDRFGMRNIGTFFSVDTGKYSSAPWLSQMLLYRLRSGPLLG